jgi:hypothetical protein
VLNRMMFYISAPAWVPTLLIAWGVLKFRYDTPLATYYKWFKEDVMGVR